MDIPPFTFPKRDFEANTTQTPKEWKKLVTGYVGNYTAFQYAVDGVRAEGLHNAAHLVCTSPPNTNGELIL